MLPREGNDRAVGALPINEVVTDGLEVGDCSLDTRGHDHGACLSADLFECDYLLVEMVDHNLGLEPDSMLVAFDVPPQLFLGPFSIKFGVVRRCLNKAVIAVNGGVVFENVQNESL